MRPVCILSIIFGLLCAAFLVLMFWDVLRAWLDSVDDDDVSDQG